MSLKDTVNNLPAVAPAPTVAAVYEPPAEYRGDITWDPGAAEFLEKLAYRYSLSIFTPEQFRNRPADCALALEMAYRLRVAPPMMFQNLSVINDKPFLSAQFLIALAATAKRPIAFRVERLSDEDFKFTRSSRKNPTGEDVRLEDIAVTAYFEQDEKKSVRVTMRHAAKVGWANNVKYSEIPEQMLCYRAATFLVRRYLPHLSMGLATIEEVADEVVPAVPTPDAAVPTPPRGLAAVRDSVLHDDGTATVTNASGRELKAGEPVAAEPPATDTTEPKVSPELAAARAELKAVLDLPPEDVRRRRLVAYGNANQIRRWGGMSLDNTLAAVEASKRFPLPEDRGRVDPLEEKRAEARRLYQALGESAPATLDARTEEGLDELIADLRVEIKEIEARAGGAEVPRG